MIVQPQLEVPAKIAAGLANGSYVLLGGVVRDAVTGRLVALLKDAPGAVKSGDGIGRASGLLKSRSALVAGALGALGVGTAAVAVVTKRRQAARRALPPSVADVSASLQAYLDAASRGTLTAGVITRLLTDLDAMRATEPSGGTALELPETPWVALAELVAGHTPRLAAAYSVDVKELTALVRLNGQPSAVDELRRHLDLQRQVLTSAPGTLGITS